MTTFSTSITWVGALVAIVISILLVFLVNEWMWVGVALFLVSVVALFVLSVGSEGWRKATWEALKRLLTGW